LYSAAPVCESRDLFPTGRRRTRPTASGRQWTAHLASKHAEGRRIRAGCGKDGRSAVRAATTRHAMSLTPQDIDRLAELARIRFDDGEKAQLLEKLNQVFDVIEALRAADTEGVEPMTHPQVEPLRLREDVVTEGDEREANQAHAPSVEDGLYLVPRVVE
jgi:aspartyl-tRNA(Asn)/glutamyl-tRNA(Gln) amidotransferase subunit C